MTMTTAEEGQIHQGDKERILQKSVVEDRLAIVERPERRELQVNEKEKTTTCCRYYDHLVSLPLYSDYLPFTVHVHYIAICCSATTGSFQLHQLETG